MRLQTCRHIHVGRPQTSRSTFALQYEPLDGALQWLRPTAPMLASGVCTRGHRVVLEDPPGSSPPRHATPGRGRPQELEAECSPVRSSARLHARLSPVRRVRGASVRRTAPLLCARPVQTALRASISRYAQYFNEEICCRNMSMRATGAESFSESRVRSSSKHCLCGLPPCALLRPLRYQASIRRVLRGHVQALIAAGGAEKGTARVAPRMWQCHWHRDTHL